MKKEKEEKISKKNLSNSCSPTPNIKNKDKNCRHLTNEENQMLDIIATIMVEYILRIHNAKHKT